MSVNELRKSAVEVNAILKHLPVDVSAKIPSTVKVFFEQIASDTYSFNYDVTKKLTEQNLMPKTKGVIALIYRDYICSKEERLEYIQKYNAFLEKKHNAQNSIVQNVSKSPSNTALPIVSENPKWYAKIFNTIKNFFKK